MIWIQIRTGMALWIRIRNPTETIADSKNCANKAKVFFLTINTQNNVLQEKIYLHKTVQRIGINIEDLPEVRGV
jgi:hypothetical protein